MARRPPAAKGHKRPQLDINIDRLHLDPANPRLPEEVQGKSEEQVLQHLYDHFVLEEIADPMGKNGYFDEEPLVVVPQKIPTTLVAGAKNGGSKKYRDFIERKDTHFTVVEGNRRLATAMILQDAALQEELKVRSWPAISADVRADLGILPVIVYPSREEVLPYLGVRHITGNKKWDSYAKARYIADMMRAGHSVEEIEGQVGDRVQGVRKNAIAYYMLQEAKEELEWNIDRAKNEFSLLLLAIGQRNIKLYLGWSRQVPNAGELKTIKLEEIDLESPVPESHVKNLRDLLSWLYGEGTKLRPVINESRDITNYLSAVVASESAVEYLRQTRNLLEAYDLTDGEEAMLKKLLRSANTKLEKSLGVAHRHKTTEIADEATKCYETAGRVVKSVSE
jgi:hypothetical protein